MTPNAAPRAPQHRGCPPGRRRRGTATGKQAGGGGPQLGLVSGRSLGRHGNRRRAAWEPLELESHVRVPGLRGSRFCSHCLGGWGRDQIRKKPGFRNGARAGRSEKPEQKGGTDEFWPSEAPVARHLPELLGSCSHLVLSPPGSRFAPPHVGPASGQYHPKPSPDYPWFPERVPHGPLRGGECVRLRGLHPGCGAAQRQDHFRLLYRF